MLTLTSENWQARANCRDVAPETMQPEVATRRDIYAAKLICSDCPVRLQCKALANSQPGGAYGIHAGEWYGPNPGTAETCSWCGVEMVDTASHKRQFCGDTCRKRAARAASVANSVA